ncbi:MAG: 4-hydroxythreonine-4-phosphate dehydrogenase PdxA [Actinomycetota bacterium]
MKRPIVAITMGDAAGIGPEISAKALKEENTYKICRPVILGDAGVMEKIIDICRLGLKVNAADGLKNCRFCYGTADVIDYSDIDADRLQFGKEDKMCGRAAVRYTIEAGKMAMEGKVDAMVSAPLNKSSMRKAGYNYEGQTQILGELTGAKNYGMILVLGNLHIMMYSTHMSLREAIEKVTSQGLLEKIKLARQGLALFGLREPIIAVSALNPHAGERGLFGREEIDQMVPAIEEAKKLGIKATGPVSADSVFLKARQGEYDLVIAMYHDQANIAMKLLGFGHVVTLLAGIPIIRTSTGHGTAFDIAGKNAADATNLIKAIALATQLGVKTIKGDTGDRRN